MLIDDLPRLTDEERELADDEYVVMPAAVPTNLSIDDLIAQRTAALAAMRTAGDDFAAFSRASRQEAELAAQIRRVRRQAVVTNPPKVGPACPDCHGSGVDPAEGTRCERCEGSGNAPDVSAAKVDVGKSWRRVLGFLSRLRQRRQQQRLARAQAWLDACQYAAENHPGMYDDIEREAQRAVARLKEANPQQK